MSPSCVPGSRSRAPSRSERAHSITSADALVRETERIRADGYARDMEESEIGVRCLAAPVFLGSALPRAAVSVSAPRERLPASRIRAVVPSC